jgi:hypothetical protein
VVFEVSVNTPHTVSKKGNEEKNIIFQHSVALINDLNCRDSLEGATCCCARSICYLVTFL